MAAVATDRLPLRQTEIGWPLDEMWVGGALLEPAEEIDHGTIVSMIDLQPDELPWLAVHPTAEWIGEQLRLGKRPISWIYRPTAWPAWNVRHQQVTRFWSAGSGLDHAGIDALRSGATADLVEPDRREMDEQLAVELKAAKAHLRSILEHYVGPRLATRQPPPHQPRKSSSGELLLRSMNSTPRPSSMAHEEPTALS